MMIGIAKMHLKGSETFSLPGYKWYGHNRQKLHAKAEKGFGEEGCLINT